jgi:SPP1 gp7 family putative phage head morphogenesis protein
MKAYPELLPFKEAVEFFAAKGLAVSPDSWRDVWASEHIHAFTVARVTVVDVLEDIRKAVGKAVADGTSIQLFKSELSRLLTKKGWFAEEPDKDRRTLTPWRLETIYRTNLQSAYQAGRFKQLIETAHVRPFWMYDAVRDHRTRPFHAALHGKVYRFDHPFWNTWYPPNGFNCRCTVRSLSEARFERMKQPLEDKMPPYGPDPGFDFNPGMVRWQPDLSRYSPEARGLITRDMIARPWNIPSLAEDLTRLRDGYGQTGIVASDKPLTIKSLAEEAITGWSNPKTGEIALPGEVYERIRWILSNGAIRTEWDTDAFRLLVHEFGHHLGRPVELARYNADPDYSALKEAVNDLWARHHVPETARALNLESKLSAFTESRDWAPSTYGAWVEHLRAVLRKLGFDEAEEKRFITELNLSEKPENLSDRLWTLVRQKKPNIAADRPFGEVIRLFWLWERLMDEL